MYVCVLYMEMETYLLRLVQTLGIGALTTAAKLHQEYRTPLLVRYGARSLLPPLRPAGGYLEAQLCCGK